MSNKNRWLIAILALMLSLLFWVCQSHDDSHHTEHPANVEKIEGSDLSRVSLSEKAIERLDLKTGNVREVKVKRSNLPRKVVPYSSLIYDPQGNTWIYTSPQPRTFVRHRVDVDYIEDDLVILNEGPAVGTVIATVAVAELYGTEFAVGH